MRVPARHVVLSVRLANCLIGQCFTSWQLSKKSLTQLTGPLCKNLIFGIHISRFMRIVVFGATGGTGRALLRKLLDGAHQDTVVALCRNPGALDDIKASAADASRLEVVKGDLFDAASVSAAVRGADVVVFTAGIPNVWTAVTKKTTIYSIGGKHVLDAMKAEGVKRLIAVTSDGVVADAEAPILFKYVFRPLMSGMYNDMAKLESLITQAAADTNLSYTTLRPTKLEDDQSAVGGTEVLCVGEGSFPKGPVYSYKVCRSELADVILDALYDEAKHAGKTLHVSH